MAKEPPQNPTQTLKLVPKSPGRGKGAIRAPLWNQRCVWCSGPLAAPLRGPIPTTCSGRCRTALSRHNKRRAAAGITATTHGDPHAQK